MKKKTIITIGGWNGHSNLLAWMQEEWIWKTQLFSIVSMSDDGRTTGKLMRLFEEAFWIHLPPPGDLRRCLFSLSESKYKNIFTLILEHTFLGDTPINHHTLFDLFIQSLTELSASDIWKDKQEKNEIEDFFKGKWDFYKKVVDTLAELMQIKLPLSASIKGHKFWNLCMASIFFNLKDYEKMLDVMHTLLEVDAKVLPVTIDKATIEAVLENGEIIVSQDAISNVAEYTHSIETLRLTDGSEKAHHIKIMDEIFSYADEIILAPWDLYTSTISNLIIGWIKDLISNAKGKIVYIANNTNKGWETNGYRVIDFVEEIEKYVGRKIDVLIVNNYIPKLSSKEENLLRENISVKWGEYIFLSNDEKKNLESRGIQIIEGDFIDRKSLYKHDREKIAKVIKKL